MYHWEISVGFVTVEMIVVTVRMKQTVKRPPMPRTSRVKQTNFIAMMKVTVSSLIGAAMVTPTAAMHPMRKIAPLSVKTTIFDVTLASVLLANWSATA